MALKLFSEDLHHGGMSGLSLSSWSPVFMTCGRLDRTVKLWNYEKQVLVFTERYHEDVLNVSLHPTGQSAMLALASSVQFCMVHADRLVSRRVLAVKNCSLVRFSRSGQMCAVVDGLNVVVYCSITFKKLHQLSAHKKPVNNNIRSFTQLVGIWFLFRLSVLLGCVPFFCFYFSVRVKKMFHRKIFRLIDFGDGFRLITLSSLAHCHWYFLI